jgi:hypothetical protein
MTAPGNLLADVPASLAEEQASDLLLVPGVRMKPL